MNSTAPVLIGYDGSDTARRAVRETAELFGSRRALVVTVWEQGLAYEAIPMATGSMDNPAIAPVMASAPVDPEVAEEIDDTLHARAERIAQDGVVLAKSLGLQAKGLAVADEGINVAGAIIDVARERDVAAIVIGSRGLTGLRARLEGSTSSAVLRHSPCPVLTVHED